MNNFVFAFGLTVALAMVLNTVNADYILTTCAQMGTPILEKVAQGECILSCKFQNCGTGHCENRGGRPVCVCSRCDNGGGEWPNIPSGGKGK